MDFLNVITGLQVLYLFGTAFSLEISDFAMLSHCAVGLLPLLTVTFEAKEVLVMINSDGSTLLVTYGLVVHP